MRVLLLGPFVALTLVHPIDDLAARRIPRSTSAEMVRQISTDTLTGGGGQHATEVEPDSNAFGSTVVAVFQVGRIRTGGATVIAIAVSRNGGSSWKSSLLPGLTKLSPHPGADDCQIQSSPPRSSPDGPCSCSHSLADQWRGCFDNRS